MFSFGLSLTLELHLLGSVMSGRWYRITRQIVKHVLNSKLLVPLIAVTPIPGRGSFLK